MVETRVVVGLGNPGEKYSGTRHNVGFEVVDSLANKFGIEAGKKKFGARIGECFYRDKKLILVKPWEYMNLSGQAVATVMGFYQLELADLLVIYDDMSIECGSIRLRKKGSAGGHNGVSDVIAKLDSNKFCRLRVGIGDSGRADAVSYVLGRISKQERELLDPAIEKARDAVLCWLESGMDQAMNRYNIKDESK